MYHFMYTKYPKGFLGKFLSTSGQQYGRPISGQFEVVALSATRNSALWKTAEGIFMVRSGIPE